jgi:cytochrome c-type biogenesis protein CcmH
VTPPASPTAAPGATSGATPAAPSDVEISDRAYAIAGELRCPVCTAESVADSNAEIAGEMRRLIQQQLDAGKNRQQIVSYFRQRYGDWILLDPPKTGLHLVVWLLPLLALLGGIVTLAVLVRRWRAAADAVPAAPEEDLERVRAAMRGREDEN